jgi:sporulation protein YlmC with PRC-barrel domain
MRIHTTVTAAAMLGIALGGSTWAQMSGQGSSSSQGQQGSSGQYQQDSGYRQGQDQWGQRQGYDTQQQQQDNRFQSQRYGQGYDQQQTQSRWPHSEARVQRASRLIGADVRNWNNEKLGDVSDLVINRSQGQVIYAAISRGGFMGVGNTLHAVPFEALRLSSDGQYFILDVPQRTLNNAQGFDDNNWPAIGNSSLLNASQQQRFNTQDPRYQQQQDQRYQQQRDQRQWQQNQGYDSQRYDSERGSRDRSDLDRRSDDVGRDPSAYHMLGEGGPSEWPYVFDDERNQVRDRQNTYDQRSDQQYRGQLQQQYQQHANQQQKMQHQQFGQQGQRAQSVDWPVNEDLRWSNRVSKLLGSDLNDQQGRDIGEIEDLALDMREGRIAFVVIRDDETRGGERLVAMPWRAVTFDQNEEVYALSVDRQTLAQAPSFNDNSWPNLADSRFITSVYRAFGVEPYYTTYGYTVYELDQQPQQQYGQQQHGTLDQGEQRYIQQFQQGQQRTLNGQVQRILAVTPESGMPRVLAVEVSDGQRGATLVHIGPINQVRDMIQIRRGDQIQVTGKQAQINNQSVVIAQQVQLDGRTIQIRDRNGSPLYRQPQQRYQTNPSYDSQQDSQRFQQNQGYQYQNQ